MLAGRRNGALPATVTTGLTKREYFAGVAIQSAIGLPWAQGSPRQAAEIAVDFADELLRALAATDGGEKQ